MVERLHRLLLDVVKDEFERLGIIDINSVQALLLFNIGDNEVTAGELKTRGYYQGSNVSYNLKKLVECGYMHHQKCDVDRRAVRVRLTEKGRNIRTIIAAAFPAARQRHPEPRGARQHAARGHQRQPAPHGALLERPDPLHLLSRWTGDGRCGVRLSATFAGIPKRPMAAKSPRNMIRSRKIRESAAADSAAG